MSRGPHHFLRSGEEGRGGDEEGKIKKFIIKNYFQKKIINLIRNGYK